MYEPKYDPKVTASLVIVPLPPKKHWQDHSHICMTVDKWATTSTLDPQLLKIAKYVVMSIGLHGTIIPYLDAETDSILLTWSNGSDKQRRLLYIQLKLGQSFRYQISPHAVIDGDYAWQFVTDSSHLKGLLRELSNYMEDQHAKAS